MPEHNLYLYWCKWKGPHQFCSFEMSVCYQCSTDDLKALKWYHISDGTDLWRQGHPSVWLTIRLCFFILNTLVYWKKQNLYIKKKTTSQKSSGLMVWCLYVLFESATCKNSWNVEKECSTRTTYNYSGKNVNESLFSSCHSPGCWRQNGWCARSGPLVFRPTWLMM